MQVFSYSNAKKKKKTPKKSMLIALSLPGGG
jgi:hypothetical protein